MDSNLLESKSIGALVSDVEDGGKALKRRLSARDLTLPGIIGTGIFVLAAAPAVAPPGTLINFRAMLTSWS